MRQFARRLALRLPPLKRLVQQRDAYAAEVQQLAAVVQQKDVIAQQRDAYALQVEQLAAVVQQKDAIAQQRDDYARELQDTRLEVARLGAECEVLCHGNESIREQISQLTQQLQVQTRSVTSEIEHLRAERLRRSGLDGASENRSLFFVSLPKSGTVFTWHCLQSITGLRIPDFHQLEGWSEYTAGWDFSCPDLYACGDYHTQMLRPGNMKHFLHGFVFGSHMQPSYHNMRVLKETGITRISVLLRDPRDALVSWVYHLSKLGASARNYHSKIYSIPREYYDWPLQQQIAFQIRTFLPTVVNRVEGWLDYYAHDPGGPTMRGVIQREYTKYRAGRGLPNQSVRYNSEAELQDIYAGNYWKPMRGDLWPKGPDQIMFDIAVNSARGARLRSWGRRSASRPAAWSNSPGSPRRRATRSASSSAPAPDVRASIVASRRSAISAVVGSPATPAWKRSASRWRWRRRMRWDRPARQHCRSNSVSRPRRLRRRSRPSAAGTARRRRPAQPAPAGPR